MQVEIKDGAMSATTSIRRWIQLLSVGLAIALAASGCTAATTAASNPAVQRLAGQIIILVAEEGVSLVLENGLDSETASSFANVVGTFVYDQVDAAIFGEDAWYVIIHHWVNDEPATTVVEIRNDSHLGIKVKGEADIYPFTADRQFLFDALPYEETEITVFNRETEFEYSAEGIIELPAFGTAYDLETGTSFEVDDPNLLPTGADLYFDQEERYANLVSGAGAVSRHGVVPTLDICNSFDDSAWRTNLVPTNVPDLAEAWCVRTAEGQYGLIEVVEGNLSFAIWVTD